PCRSGEAHGASRWFVAASLDTSSRGGGVVLRPSDIFVVLGQREGRLFFQRTLVEATLQDRVHRPVRGAADAQRSRRSGLQTWRTVAVSEAEQPKTCPVALLWMGAVL